MVSRNFEELTQARAVRARQLAAQFREASAPLLFLAQVAEFQGTTITGTTRWSDLPSLAKAIVDLLQQAGTEQMRQAVEGLRPPDLEKLLTNYWHRESPAGLDNLPARILLQPFAFRAPADVPPRHRKEADPAELCPRCFHPPQVGLLRGQGHGQALRLVCSLCLHDWVAPRNRCNFCGNDRNGSHGRDQEGKSCPSVGSEEQSEELAYFSADGFTGRSLQSCQSCHRYIHLIDLDQEPAAVADADELAGLTLDAWAAGRGLQKIHPNLAGI